MSVLFCKNLNNKGSDLYDLLILDGSVGGPKSVILTRSQISFLINSLN